MTNKTNGLLENLFPFRIVGHRQIEGIECYLLGATGATPHFINIPLASLAQVADGQLKNRLAEFYQTNGISAQGRPSERLMFGVNMMMVLNSQTRRKLNLYN